MSMISLWITDPFWFEDIEFRRNMRMTHRTFVHLVEMVAPDVKDSVHNKSGHIYATKEFKVAVCLYYLGHGSTWRNLANVAQIGVATARKYTKLVCGAVIARVKPTYMPGTPCPDRIARMKRKFYERRNIGDVAMCVDGTHVPWTPDCARHREDYHNYKGWHSILCLMFVDSFYLFIDGEVGHPGRQSDSAVSEYSWLFAKIREDPQAWLGKDGIMVGDGGFAQTGYMMTPYAKACTNREHYFNFCFSSTRFYVEQAFGWWKNRFRFLIRASQLSHADQCLCIYATMILHNVCVTNGEMERRDWNGLLGTCMVDSNGRKRDIELTRWYASHEKVMCNECRGAVPQKLYCVHADRIAAEDLQLAQENGRERGDRLPPIRSAQANLGRRRDEVADELWARFMAAHPGFSGPLQEWHLSTRGE